MKRFGQIIGFVGLFLIIADGFWLKLAFSWWSTVGSLCLLGLGFALAGIGGVLFKRDSPGAKDSDPKPPIN
jgi:hypothetical protein